jgi:hypothetical protein
VNLEAVRAKWPVGIGATIALAALAYLFFSVINIDRRPIPAGESSAIGWLRNIVHEQDQFRAQHGCFASELSQLPGLSLRDHDYSYVIVPGEKDAKNCITSYLVTASPISERVRGARYFSIDQVETLRSEKLHPTSLESPVLQ